jgi:hypothetical protein
MKKIKHIKDIQQEKMRLRIQQLEQEKDIRNHWNEMKEGLRPGVLLRSKLSELPYKGTTGTPLLTSLVTFGAGYLTRRLTGMASEKIESAVQLGMEKLTGKMKTVFRKKHKG